MTSADFWGTRSVLRRQSTTVGCLLSSRRHADAESRITSTTMRRLPRSDLGGEKIADGPTQNLHSMRAKRRRNHAEAALVAICNRKIDVRRVGGHPGSCCQDLMKANKSALIVSAWVVGMPCGKPL